MSGHLAVPEAGLVLPVRPQLVRWGRLSFRGPSSGLEHLALLDALWLALSFGSHEISRLQQPVVVDCRHRYFLHFPRRPRCPQ